MCCFACSAPLLHSAWCSTFTSAGTEIIVVQVWSLKFGSSLELALLSSFSERQAERLGRARASDETRQDEHGHHIRENLDELNWDRLVTPEAYALQPDLDGF